MNTVVSICFRAGSKRVPDKWAQYVGGLTLWERTLYQALEYKGKNKIVVCTDVDHIERGRVAGFDFLHQPAEFAAKGQNKWLLFRYIVEKYPCDVLIDLDIGCPFRSLDDIQVCADMLEAGHPANAHWGFDVVCTAYESERNPYFNMVKKDGSVVMPSNITNSQDAPKVYSLSPSVYAIKTSALKQYQHWSQANLGIHLIPRVRAWDIDTPFDLEVARLLAEREA